jgi:hypothetical protein
MKWRDALTIALPAVLLVVAVWIARVSGISRLYCLLKDRRNRAG